MEETLQDLVEGASSAGAIPALAVVQYCLSDAKTTQQCKDYLNNWNRQGASRLPTRKLRAGKAVLAVETVTQLRALAGRCVKAGADAARVAEATGRLAQALTSGASTSGVSGGARVDHTSCGPAEATPGVQAVQAASSDVQPNAGNQSLAGSVAGGAPVLPSPAAARAAFLKSLSEVWKDRPPAQAGVLVHGVLPDISKQSCQTLVRRWVAAGQLQLGLATFKRSRGAAARAFAIATVEDLAALILRCRAMATEQNKVAVMQGWQARLEAALVESADGTDFTASRLVPAPDGSTGGAAGRAATAATRAEAAVADLEGAAEPVPGGSGPRRRAAAAGTAGKCAAEATTSAATQRSRRHQRGGRHTAAGLTAEAAELDAAAVPPAPHVLHPDGLWARSWRGLGRRAWGIAKWSARWQALRTVLTLYTCCALCGYCCYPSSDELAKWGTRTPSADSTGPPYEMHNVLHPGTMAGADGIWLLCPKCAGQQKADGRLEHVVHHPPDYAREIVRHDPALQMLLALVNVGAGFASNAKGYFTARLQQPHAVGAALLAWDAATACSPATLREVLRWGVAFNPVYQAFLSVLEQRSPDAALPFLSPDSVAAFAADAKARGPLELLCTEHEELCRAYISAVVPTAAPPAAHRAPPTSYTVGTLHPRLQMAAGASTSNGAGLQVTILPDGSTAPSSAQLADSNLAITAELALFPYLFPFGTGSFDGLTMTLAQYLEYRSRCFMSVWTLTKPYLLLMSTIRTTTMLYGGNRTRVVLERAIADYRRRHPDASDAKILKHIIKYNLPSSMPNTPSWHRRNLQDLLALVDRWGMPTHFLTLTADEFSATHWEEVDSLQDMLERFCSTFTFRDAPAENAYLFHRRLQSFMRDVLKVHKGKGQAGKAAESGVLGRVMHHVTRYEVQGRQSLHAHILLWVHPDDVDRVTSEIVACVPATYVGRAEATNEHHPNCPTGRDCWEPPADDPHALALFEHVMTKQCHTCTPINCPGCRKTGPCRYGFPWKPHRSSTPIVDTATRRYVYYRPSWAHRNISPYHPTVEFLWGAHMNLQRVTSSDWSFYVLKYAMKTEPCGKLVLSDASRVALGLPEDQGDGPLSTTYLIKLISAYLTSTVMSPTMAFLSCAQIDTVYMSSGVDFVCSSPPTTRTRTVHNGTKLCAAPIDVYSLRPSSLEHVTFTSYFRDYRLVAKKKTRRGQQAAQSPAVPMAAAAAAAGAVGGGLAAAAATATAAATVGAAAVGLAAAPVLGAAMAAAAAGAAVAGAAGWAATAMQQHEQDGPVMRQAPPGAELVGETMDRHHHVYKLREPRIVRFSDYNPAADPEGYFYTLLLRHVPFRKEGELLSAANTSQTYFQECRLRGLVANTSDLEVHLQSYANYHLYNSQRRQALLATLLSKYVPTEAVDDGDELDPQAATFTVEYGGLQDAPVAAPQGAASGGGPAGGCPRVRAPPRRDAAAIKAALLAEFSDLDGMPYTEAQQATVDAIRQHSCGLVVLTGGPGSGKTFTTKKLTRQLRQQGKTVMLTASTGAAAVRLSPDFAGTNHAAFGLPAGNSAMATWMGAASDAHPKAQALRDTDVFIVDEFSMMTDVQLTLILTRIFHASPYSSLDEMLEHKLIILVGDHGQLPPVCTCMRRAGHAAAAAAAATEAAAAGAPGADLDGAGQEDLAPLCEDCHIASNPFFQVAPKYRLPASVRHARDPEFAAFLDVIRYRRPTQAEIDAVFGPWTAATTLAPGRLPSACSTCFVSPEMVPLLSDGNTTVLCTHLQDAKAYNHAILERLSDTAEVGDIQPCPLEHDVPPRSRAEAALESWLRASAFRTIEQVAVGARVVLVENCDLARGAANGAAGVVEALSFAERPGDGPPVVSGIKVRLASNNKALFIGARTSEYNWHNGVRYFKRTFPLTLGWAITSHRAQGATLAGPTIIHARTVFTPGQMYVMLSRVTERRHLRLVGPITPDLFTPVRLPNFVEINALAQQQAAALPERGGVPASGVQAAYAGPQPMDVDGLD